VLIQAAFPPSWTVLEAEHVLGPGHPFRFSSSGGRDFCNIARSRPEPLAIGELIWAITTGRDSAWVQISVVAVLLGLCSPCRG